MGCGLSDESWQEEMEGLERQLFAEGDLDLYKLTSKYTMIKMEGKDYAVRTHIYNDDKDKKTLLMTHGFGMSGVLTSFKIAKPLAEHYRLVIFDNGGFGLNTKITEKPEQALSSPDASEAYIVEWWKQYVDTLTENGDLPPKFYLTAHSAGGLQAMLYASFCPERIEALFLQSPAGSEEYNEVTYDPYKIRISDKGDFAYPSKKEVDKTINILAEQKHLMGEMQGAPYWLLKSMCMSEFKNFTPLTVHKPTTAALAGHYFACMMQRQSQIEVVVLNTSRYFSLPYHSMLSTDRMCNPEIEFPVAFVFGDRDFFGSEGADQIVRSNRHFESGRSQLFKLENSGHNVFLDNPY